MAREYQYGADDVYLSDGELEEVRRYSEAYRAAEAAGNRAGMQAAHDAAEGVRSRYGYSGGQYGDQYISLPAGSGYEAAQRVKTPEYVTETRELLTQAQKNRREREPFSYDAPRPGWSDPYRERREGLTGELLDREPFQYDPARDPVWLAYRKEYIREGRRSAEDTLGSYASMTGGMPSTAALTAARQASDYYAGKLTDAIPTLSRLAYEMYQKDLNGKREDLEALSALSSEDYARYQDSLDQWNQDRSAAYRAYTDAAAAEDANIDALRETLADDWDRYKADRDLAYRSYQDGLEQERAVRQEERAALEDARKAEDAAYRRVQTAGSQARDRVDAFLASGGALEDLDPELAEASGYTLAELEALETYYSWKNAKQYGKVWDR